MESDTSLEGAARLVLADNVVHLDPKPALFAGMLEGWERQQRARFLQLGTISGRLALVRRFAAFSNQYPWEWTAGEVEAFFSELRSGARPIAPSTGRGYQVVLRLFLDYVTDVRYGWAAECERRFGAAPVQLLHEWNTVSHLLDYEGAPRRRPLSYDEVQALFDAADSLVEDIREKGRKGALTAQRDAALLKAVYAFGLRRREVSGLDLADLRRNPKIARYGRFGALLVRWGKGTAGSPPKRRTVFLVPEMDWVVEVLAQWLEQVRPLLSPGGAPGAVCDRAVRPGLGARGGRRVHPGEHGGRARRTARPALPAPLAYHPFDRVWVSRAVRTGSGRTRLRGYYGHLFGCRRRVPQPADRRCPQDAPRRPVGGHAVIKKMGVAWHLRLRMAEKGMYQTSDLVPQLAERGVELSREQVYRLVTQAPQRLSMDVLAALCDILACTPNDLIEVTAAPRSVRKAAGGTGPAPAVRRSTIRRPRDP